MKLLNTVLRIVLFKTSHFSWRFTSAKWCSCELAINWENDSTKTRDPGRDQGPTASSEIFSSLKLLYTLPCYINHPKFKLWTSKYFIGNLQTNKESSIIVTLNKNDKSFSIFFQIQRWQSVVLYSAPSRPLFPKVT